MRIEDKYLAEGAVPIEYQQLLTILNRYEDEIGKARHKLCSSVRGNKTLFDMLHNDTTGLGIWGWIEDYYDKNDDGMEKLVQIAYFNKKY